MAEFNNKKELIITAISDLHQTIRFLDTKSGAIIAVAGVSITGITAVLNRITTSFAEFPALTKYIIIVGTVIFTISSLLSVLLSLKSINPKHNPKDHITGFDNTLNFSFVINETLDKSYIRSLFTDKDKCHVEKTAKEMLEFFNNCNDEDILKVLITEFLKLSYIRMIKAHRTKFALGFIQYCIITIFITTLLAMFSLYFNVNSLLEKLPVLNINIIIVFFIGHLVGDFLLQTNDQATKKEKYFRYLAAHSLIYSATIVILLCLFSSARLSSMFIIFIILILSHIIIDSRKLTNIWLKYIKRMPNMDSIVVLFVDQTFHYIVLAGIYILAK